MSYVNFFFEPSSSPQPAMFRVPRSSCCLVIDMDGLDNPTFLCLRSTGWVLWWEYSTSSSIMSNQTPSNFHIWYTSCPSLVLCITQTAIPLAHPHTNGKSTVPCRHDLHDKMFSNSQESPSATLRNPHLRPTCSPRPQLHMPTPEKPPFTAPWPIQFDFHHTAESLRGGRLSQAGLIGASRPLLPLPHAAPRSQKEASGLLWVRRTEQPWPSFLFNPHSCKTLF